jgi:hypothetical protein
MLTASQKDDIINSRGQSTFTGTKSILHNVIFNDGTSCNMISMLGADEEEAKNICVDKFGYKFSHIEVKNGS